MSSSSDDAKAVVALLLAYIKSQQKRKCLWIRPWLSRRKDRDVYHTLTLRRLYTIATNLNPDKSSRSMDESSVNQLERAKSSALETGRASKQWHHSGHFAYIEQC
ncbi:hypothetical protein E2C01_080462 [Portunus trituberculatus]|uniref:Uncharacterized protein n=1 Tax=Portunus trituberculatus TaxID=210409 RepID=A0A5B7IU60_PORTR|nr:hypothetical protein [Portunus trituberculatus]